MPEHFGGLNAIYSEKLLVYGNVMCGIEFNSSKEMSKEMTYLRKCLSVKLSSMHSKTITRVSLLGQLLKLNNIYNQIHES